MFKVTKTINNQAEKAKDKISYIFKKQEKGQCYIKILLLKDYKVNSTRAKISHKR